MKTYALFSSTSKEPLQTYEGEEMVQNKEYVSIYKRVPRQNSAHSEAGSSCCDSPWPRPVGESNLRASFRCSWNQNGPGVYKSFIEIIRIMKRISFYVLGASQFACLAMAVPAASSAVSSSRSSVQSC
jgi:hypothetical protein